MNFSIKKLVKMKCVDNDTRVSIDLDEFADQRYNRYMPTSYLRRHLLISLMLSVLTQACTSSNKDESDLNVFVEPGMFLSSKNREIFRHGSYVRPPSVLSIGEDSSQSFLSKQVFVRNPISSVASTMDVTPAVTCVGINVMGVNISSAYSGEGAAAWGNYKSDVLAGDTCSYPGKVSNAVSVSTGGTISLKVPFGPSRVIQLVGYSGVECNRSFSGTGFLDTDAVPGAYEIGRTVTDLYSASPSVDLGFDLSVIDQIEANEQAPDENTFVPDIRCQVKGEPAEQIVEVKAAAAATCNAGTYWNGTECIAVGAGYYSTGGGQRDTCTNKPSNSIYTDNSAADSSCAWSCDSGYNKMGSSCVACAAGTFYSEALSACTDVGAGYYSTGDGVKNSCSNLPANATYSGTGNATSTCEFTCNTGYVQDGTQCIYGAGLNCAANEVVVGINVRAGAILDRIGVRCAPLTASGIGTAYDGPYVGGMGGAPFTYNCPTGSMLTLISGKNGTAEYTTSTANHHYQCVDLLTAELQALSDQYGGSSGSPSFSYSCTGGKYIYGLNVGSDVTGAFSGFTLGVSCRSCPAGTYWTGGSCKAVGNGYFSTGTGNRTACSNLPADPFATYLSSYSTSSNCEWTCSGGRQKQLNAATGQYSCVPYSISYSANGGSGSMSSEQLTAGSSTNLTQNSFSRSEYIFAGWATSATGGVVYNDQDLFTMGISDVTLYAVWTAASALVAKYDFNLQSMNDQSGNANHATAYNVNYVSDGNGGYAASLNGSSSYISIPNDLLRSNSTFTVMMRFKATAGNYGVLLGYQNTQPLVSPGEWVPILAVRSDGKLYGELWTSAGSLALVSSAVVNDSQWHTVYFSGTAGSIKLYLDGAVIGSGTGTALGLSMIYNQIGLGHTPPRPYLPEGWSFFNGQLKNFLLYNSAL